MAVTVHVRAVAELCDEGLVVAVRGRGRFVRVPASELVRFGRSRYRRHPKGLGPNRDEAEAGGYFDEIDQGILGTTRARQRLSPGCTSSPVHP
jgi:hypothetical protein